MQAQTSPPASSFDAQHFPKLQPVSHHTKPHLHSTSATYTITMAPQSLLRANPRMASMVSRRLFHATRARLSSPFHYPEGPYSNLPFNTKTRFFAVRYWLYCITGFFTPFGIAVWQTYKPAA